MDELEASSSGEKASITFPQAHIYSLSGNDPKLSGSILESTNNHGDKISIDISKKPPQRELSLANSEYALEADNSIGVLHKPEAEYLKTRDKLSTTLTVLNTLQTKLVQGHIKDLADHGYTLPEVKSHLKLVYKIDVDFIGSMDELISLSSLQSKQAQCEKNLKQAKTKYQEAMRLAIDGHRKEVFEKDEKTREVLQFVSGIGFDLIPKERTDQLISEVKSGMIIIKGLSLAPSRMNLKDGEFGESPSEANGTQWKKNLVEFYNMMISGTPDKPLSVEAHIGSGGKTEDKTKMKYELISSGVLTSSGSFNIEKARRNLSKEIV